MDKVESVCIGDYCVAVCGCNLSCVSCCQT